MNPADLRMKTYKTMVGTSILDRYDLHELIGLGGMGAVFRGNQRAINRTVAIKILPKLDPLTAARFHREAKTASRLSHPNTITVFDFGQTPDGYLFLVMEHLEGITLRTAIKDSGPFLPRRAIQIAIQTCRSLSEAHSAGIVHRDIKPDNIFLINRDDDPDFVKVLDFGIAKVMAADEEGGADLTQAGRIVGTPRYMAPEQVMSMPIDHRADIYSLGVILYQMITGTPPFDDASTPMLMMKHAHEMPSDFSERMNPNTFQQLPPGLEDVVMRALQKNPDHRQQTVDALRAELEMIRSAIDGIESGMFAHLQASASYHSLQRPSHAPHSGHYAPNPAHSTAIPQTPRPPHDPSNPSNPTPMSASHPSLHNVSSGHWHATPNPSGQFTPNPADPSHPSQQALIPLPPPQVLPPNPSGHYTAPHNPQNSSNKTPLLIAIAAVALLALGGVAFLLFSSSTNETTTQPNAQNPPPSQPTPKTPTPLSTVAITIESTPPGATILIGDLEVGQTPKTISLQQTARPVEYTLRKDGFKTVSQTFSPSSIPQSGASWKPTLEEETPTKTTEPTPPTASNTPPSDTTQAQDPKTTPKTPRTRPKRNTPTKATPPPETPKEPAKAPPVETPPKPKDTKPKKPKVKALDDGGSKTKVKILQ